MIKRIIAAFAIGIVMAIVGSVMFGNASALPGFPEVQGEVLFDGRVEDGRMAVKVIKENEDSYRVEIIYTQKGRSDFAMDGEIRGCQIDMAIDKVAMQEMIDNFDGLEIELD